MRIIGHRLYTNDDTALPFSSSPNHGGRIHPEYVLLHYTAGGSAEAVVKYLQSPHLHASTHVVVARDGSVTQMVPFDTSAWHAGRCIWEGRENLNPYSIGIHLENAGWLQREGNRWVDWASRACSEDHVLLATHKYGGDAQAWQSYTEAQINATIDLVQLLVREYGLKDVLGHEDVAPGLKFDPGPAFPMAHLREAVFGPEASKEPIEQIPPLTRPIRVFYSYSHEDEELRLKLEKHLSILRRKGYIDDWHDRKIGAGDNWQHSLDQYLQSAQLILLLVSANFMASDYCYDIEMREAMQRQAAGEAQVIPVILRPVDWHGAPFEKLQILPKDAKPVTTWKDQDEAFFDIAVGIRRAMEEKFGLGSET